MAALANDTSIWGAAPTAASVSAGATPGESNPFGDDDDGAWGAPAPAPAATAAAVSGFEDGFGDDAFGSAPAAAPAAPAVLLTEAPAAPAPLPSPVPAPAPGAELLDEAFGRATLERASSPAGLRPSSPLPSGRPRTGSGAGATPGPVRRLRSARRGAWLKAIVEDPIYRRSCVQAVRAQPYVGMARCTY